MSGYPTTYPTLSGVTKAHLYLAVLAYWVVSTTKYKLKESGINVRWEELLRIMSAQQRLKWWWNRTMVTF